MKMKTRWANKSQARSWRVLALLALALHACKDARSRSERASQPGAQHAAAELAPTQRIARVLPYPPGRWRLASPGALARTMVWASHILIRYRDVGAGRDVPFNLNEWSSLPPPPERSRDEGLVLARRVQRSAAADPAGFASLAAQYSEDISTAERGGSLGGLEALQLFPWPVLLDTLAALPQGQVSEVVETPYGFHVFLRREPPPEQIITGSHIVIGHDDARWLHQLLARRPVPPRSRETAQALAREVQALAAAHPERFDELVERYSEHQDAALHGDMGTWSTHEPNPYARELELLARLQIGEVADPLETFTGFSILRRMPDLPRPEYAADVLELHFDPTVADGEPQSRGQVKKHMQVLLDELAEHPELFREYQQRYCCTDVRTWRDGRAEAPLLSSAVARLGMGEQAPELLDSLSSFSIVRRAAVPPPLPLGPIALELPDPKQPDLGALIRQGVSVRDTMIGLVRVVDATREALQLDTPTAARLAALHEIEPRLAADDAQPYKTIAQLFDGVRALLGNEGYDRYQAILNRYFETLILRGQAS